MVLDCKDNTKVCDELLQLECLLSGVTRGNVLSLCCRICNGGLLGTLPRHCSPFKVNMNPDIDLLSSGSD